MIRSAVQSFWGRLLLGAAFFIIIFWMLLAWKAHGHYRAGRVHQAAGRMLEAAREYQTAIGLYAPLNPWSHAAAKALRGLAQDVRSTDPSLAFEIEDRLRRSVRGIRWMVRPYRDILAGMEDAPEKALRDPNPWMFFLSLAGLGSCCAALLIPNLSLWTRAAAFTGGLAVWALALRWC